LIRAAEVSAQPAPIASGTRPLTVWRVRAARGFEAHAQRSFFERGHGLGILLVSQGPSAHMREAQLLEGAIDCVVRHREPELLIQPHDQIARPPAYHAMDRRDRTAGDPQPAPVERMKLAKSSL